MGKTKWACGHSGEMQLRGSQRQRDARIAKEAGRKCLVCWLVERWEKEGDPRATKADRYRLAAAIAENKGIRIFNLPERKMKMNVWHTWWHDDGDDGVTGWQPIGEPLIRERRHEIARKLPR